jgi:hypothetical protein
VEPVEEPAGEEPERTTRDALYEQLGIDLLNAGLLVSSPEFVADVRAHAGFRAAPRQIASVVQELTRSAQPINAEAVARIVSDLRGYASTRQRRHADQWLALGSALTVRGLDGSPAGQRAFIGQARGIAGQHASDALLLSIALTITEDGRALDQETVGELGKRLARNAAGLAPDEIAALTRAELRDLGRECATAGKPKSRSSSAKRRPKVKPPPGPNFNTRKWRPGGRRRRALVPRRPEALE